jgi:prepilin-type N-terminal cleavage/methylation domain-containing protein
MRKPPRTTHHHDGGFTLPEILVALAIFTLIGLAMLELSSAAYYRDALHRDTLAATALAQSQVEELLKASYEDRRLFDPDGGDDVATGAEGNIKHFENPDHFDPNNPLDADGGTSGVRRFTRVWNVGANAPLTGLKTVTVLVGWRDTRGQLRVVSQTIQIARLH